MLDTLLSASGKKEAGLIRQTVIIGCIINAMLMVMKLAVGYYGHSDALVADGYHSLNDFAADLIMLIFIGISFRPADGKYCYGYGKFETFSTFLISIFLLFVACHIAIEGIESIIGYSHGETLPQPDIWTVVVVIVSMCAKEFLFRYYRNGARRSSSTAMLSNAWHHRSDAMASVATLIGVSFAHFFGEAWRILDPVASLILVGFIVVPAVRMLRPAFTELMDSSTRDGSSEKARKIASCVPGVLDVVSVKTRRNGHFLILDICIGIDGSTSVEAGYIIASEVENRLRKQYGSNLLVTVRTIPAGAVNRISNDSDENEH